MTITGATEPRIIRLAQAFEPIAHKQVPSSNSPPSYEPLPPLHLRTVALSEQDVPGHRCLLHVTTAKVAQDKVEPKIEPTTETRTGNNISGPSCQPAACVLQSTPRSRVLCLFTLSLVPLPTQPTNLKLYNKQSWVDPMKRYKRQETLGILTCLRFSASSASSRS